MKTKKQIQKQQDIFKPKVRLYYQKMKQYDFEAVRYYWYLTGAIHALKWVKNETHDSQFFRKFFQSKEI